MIDEALIAEIVKNCPAFDPTPDESGVISDDRISEYIDIQTDKITAAFHEHLLADVEAKHRNELRTFKDNELIRHCILFMDLVAAIYNLTVSNTNTDDETNNCISHLMRNQLRFYQGFVSMVMSGIPEASAAQLRTLYETYLIMQFIIKYPILVKPFTDHSIIKQYRIVRSFDLTEPLGELQQEYDRIASQYDKSFQKDYGWTAMVFAKPQDRKLSKIAESVEALGYQPLYVLSSEHVHTSSFSIRAGSHEWLIPAFSATAVELLTNGVIAFTRALGTREEHRILLMNVIYALREDLLGEPPGR